VGPGSTGVGPGSGRGTGSVPATGTLSGVLLAASTEEQLR